MPALAYVDDEVPGRPPLLDKAIAESPPVRTVRVAVRRVPEVLRVGKSVILAQKLQVFPRILVGMQPQKASVGPTSGPTWRLSHLAARQQRRAAILRAELGQHPDLAARDPSWRKVAGREGTHRLDREGGAGARRQRELGRVEGVVGVQPAQQGLGVLRRRRHLAMGGRFIECQPPSARAQRYIRS